MNKYFIAAIFLTVSLAVPLSAYSQIVKNETCIVMPGERVKEKFSVDYKGEKIYLCCKACVKGFKRHPEKYVRNLKQE